MSGNGGRQSFSSIRVVADPEMFDRPEEVIIDREENRHFAFGIGFTVALVRIWRGWSLCCDGRG